jgi:hypothetical protein
LTRWPQIYKSDSKQFFPNKYEKAHSSSQFLQ